MNRNTLDCCERQKKEKRTRISVFSCLMNSRYIAVSGVPLPAVPMSDVYSDSAKAQCRWLEVIFVVARLKPERY
jgi:hypothetical protein